MILDHTLQLVPNTTCSKCKGEGISCLVAKVEHSGESDSTSPLCVPCLWSAGPQKEALSLKSPVYGSGARAPTKAMQRTATRRELALAKTTGGRRSPASGALPFAKGDVRVKGWVIDDKTCRTKGYSLTAAFISTMRSWCKNGEKFAITIGFLDPISKQATEEVVVISRAVWEEKFFNAAVDR